MYEKGSAIKVSVEVGGTGLKELEFIGRVVLDATDFMAIQFDTIVIPKMEIKSAEPLPDRPLEEIFGTDREDGEAVERPTPPKVENVRFLPEEPQAQTKRNPAQKR